VKVDQKLNALSAAQASQKRSQTNAKHKWFESYPHRTSKVIESAPDAQ
jgi:hypothetical protein